MSLFVKPVTGSLKTAVKVIGEAPVGSDCPTAWLIVTVGGTVSLVTVVVADPTLLAKSVTQTMSVFAPSASEDAGMAVATVAGLVE